MNVLGGWEVKVEFICHLVGDAGELARNFEIYFALFVVDLTLLAPSI